MNQIIHNAIQHNYKDGNQAEDDLANHTTDGNQSGNLATKIWDQAIPVFIRQIILRDSMGTRYLRVITN